MSRTIRSKTYHKCALRSPRFRNQLINSLRFLEEVREELGAPVRPRDAAKSNPSGELVVTSWDDIVISSYRESRHA